MSQRDVPPHDTMLVSHGQVCLIQNAIISIKFFFATRNPEKSSRPTFYHLHDELSKNPRSNKLLDMTDERSTELHPQSGVLGAPLEAGKNLYPALQSAYIQRH